MASILKFEDLEIWQLARELCNAIFEIAQNSDLRNNYKLYTQIDGSLGSIMDNIAEGFERNVESLFNFYQFLKLLVEKHGRNCIEF